MASRTIQDLHRYRRYTFTPRSLITIEAQEHQLLSESVNDYCHRDLIKSRNPRYLYMRRLGGSAQLPDQTAPTNAFVITRV